MHKIHTVENVHFAKQITPIIKQLQYFYLLTLNEKQLDFKNQKHNFATSWLRMSWQINLLPTVCF